MLQICVVQPSILCLSFSKTRNKNPEQKKIKNGISVQKWVKLLKIVRSGSSNWGHNTKLTLRKSSPLNLTLTQKKINWFLKINFQEVGNPGSRTTLFRCMSLFH